MKTKKRSIEVRRKIACAEDGHPRIATGCIGYVYCARCDEQLGDTLGSSFDLTDFVLVGHDCRVCRVNAATLTTRELRLLPPNVRAEVKRLRGAA